MPLPSSSSVGSRPPTVHPVANLGRGRALFGQRDPVVNSNSTTNVAEIAGANNVGVSHGVGNSAEKAAPAYAENDDVGMYDEIIKVFIENQ